MWLCVTCGREGPAYLYSDWLQLLPEHTSVQPHFSSSSSYSINRRADILDHWADPQKHCLEQIFTVLSFHSSKSHLSSRQESGIHFEAFCNNQLMRSSKDSTASNRRVAASALLCSEWIPTRPLLILGGCTSWLWIPADNPNRRSKQYQGISAMLNQGPGCPQDGCKRTQVTSYKRAREFSAYTDLHSFKMTSTGYFIHRFL